MWLAMLGKLRTKEALWRFRFIAYQNCLLCNTECEQIQHLFFECNYSKACLECIKTWMGWKCSASRLDKLSRWILKSKKSAIKRKILSVVLTAMVYHIWRVPNDVLWNSKVWLVSNTIHRIVRGCQMRITIVIPKKVSKTEQEWIKKICTK